MVECGRKWWNMLECYRMWRIVPESGEMCGNVRMLWNVADSDGTYRKVMKCVEMFSDVVKMLLK